jgi:hypothetical protein
MRVSKELLIAQPQNKGRHIVILGAGASVAAFPYGDANGKKLPAMDNIIEVVGLEAILDRARIKYKGRNFETIYSELYASNPKSVFLEEIEKTVHSYFSSLELPDRPTLYDHLLLSLRPKDLIATFNWDPFLFDAWERTMPITQQAPKIAYLHGNVRIGYCLKHRIKGDNNTTCTECGKELTPSKLLYPVTAKNYSKDPFIKSEWAQFRYYLKHAFTLTIFGYGAPTTDREAVKIMRSAWAKKERFISRVEIIDIKDKGVLWKQWDPFIIRTYLDHEMDFYLSRLGSFPRRTCEALLEQTVYGLFVQANPIPKQADFNELISWTKPMVEAEQAISKSP